MKEKLQKVLNVLKQSIVPMLAFVCCAALAWVLIFTIIMRGAVMHSAKVVLDKVIKTVEAQNLEIAYEDAGFSRIYPFSLITLRNVELYDPKKQKSFALYIPKIAVKADAFAPRKLHIEFIGEKILQIGKEKHQITFDKLKIDVNLNEALELNEFMLTGENVDFEDMVNIGKLVLAVKKNTLMPVKKDAALFKNYLTAENVALSDKLNFPIKDKIEKIYLKGITLGSFAQGASYKDIVYGWWKDGGYFAADSLELKWQPLTLSAQGKMYANANGTLAGYFGTASHGLIEMLDTLQEGNVLSSKGTFVVKLLLADKAFKANPDDKQETVTAVMAFEDDKLLIEGVEVLNLAEDKL